MLKDVTGTVVHDYWRPYYQMQDVKHALCNAHHLRELQALIEYGKESWAKKMKLLLLFMCNYRNHFAAGVSKEKIMHLKDIYDRIIDEGLKYHAICRRHLEMASIQTRKRYPGHNLLLRLQKHRNKC